MAGGSCALALGYGRAAGACCLCQLPVPLGVRPAHTACSKGLLEQASLSSSSVVLWGGLG